MKQEKKPVFLIKKYYSILIASFAVEAMTFIITLTDSLISGNLIGSDALAAIGMIAPITALVTFITAMINSGTLLTYNVHIGNYDKEKADQTFLQGSFLAILAGFLIILGMMIGKELFLQMLSLPESMEGYLRDYYSVIMFYLCLDPLSCVLDNTLVADGGEKLSCYANIIEVTSNVLLSILLVKPFGVRGIALASLICKIVFYLLLSKWFVRKMRNIASSFHFKLQECKNILRNGVVRASANVFSSLLEAVLLLYAIKILGEGVLPLLTIAIQMLSISSVFVGLSLAAQPLIGTLRGEKNTKGLKLFMNTVFWTMFKIGLALALVTVLCSPLIIRCFGLDDPALIGQGTFMVRCIGIGYVFQILINFFFVYYYLIEKMKLAFLISVLKEFLAPTAFGLLGAFIIHKGTGLWIGLALGQAGALCLTMLTVFLRYGRAAFPWLLPADLDDRTYFYDFEITDKNVVDLSENLVSLLEKAEYSNRTGLLVGSITEDILMLIKEKNPPGNPVQTECTLILEDAGVRMILRDSGLIFDVTDIDNSPESFRDYIVSQMVCLPEHRVYLTTTGYNRNELLFG